MRVTGIPGAGKATETIDIVNREREERDLSLNQLLYLSFTRATTSEIKDRLEEVYPDEEVIPDSTVRTINSCALYLCHRHDFIDAETIILSMSEDPLFFSIFFSNYPSINFNEKQTNLARRAQEDPSELALGNRIILAYNYLQANGWDLDDYVHAPVEIERPEEKVIEVLREWERFKADNNCYQHNDYVRLAWERGLTPPVDVIVIDEFQDLSPVQYGLYKKWRDSGIVDRIYLAGDPNQSIYGFRGANPTYLADTPVDTHLELTESYRCPSAIVDRANAILGSQHGPQMEAKRDGGLVADRSYSRSHELARAVCRIQEAHDDVFLLARTNRHVRKIAYALRSEGIPYGDLKGNGGPANQWYDPAPELLRALRDLTNTGPITDDSATILQNHGIDADRLETIEGRGGEAVVPEKIVSELEGLEGQRQLLTTALRSDATHDPHEVRVGTIHAAKGLEASAVLLFAGYTSRMRDRFYREAEAEERRLYFVGVTRASEALYLIHDFFDGPEVPLL